MRTAARNQANAQRIADYYARLGIPFDRVRGLDVGEVLRTRPDWAIEQRLVPPETPRVWTAAHQGPKHTRARALSRLGDILFVAGDYRGASIAALRAIELDATTARAAVIAVSSLLRAGHYDQAGQVVGDMLRDHEQQPWMREFRERFGRYTTPASGS
jgi:hypothetical protein